MAYNRDISKLLIQAVSLAYQQFHKWEKKYSYNGDITNFPLFQAAFGNYTQVKSFKGYIPEKAEEDVICQKHAKQQCYTEKREKEGKSSPPSHSPYLGFALKSNANNIIAFRGVQTLYETKEAEEMQQVPYLWQKQEHGKIAKGISEMYTQRANVGLASMKSLRKQVFKVVKQLDPNIPCYVTGHSLGGAFAVLTALDLLLSETMSTDNVLMYNYGATRLGDPYFADFYDTKVLHSYRVVNLADYVPTLPSEVASASELTYHYKHVSQDQEWSFLTATGDMIKNHINIDFTQDKPQVEPYYTAVAREVEVNCKRQYPGSCQDTCTP
ncbi:MAG: lipase family protein [Symploca sp. SIO1B1]|nr:lipase family protein [Symploca sp. SIO1B1]